MGTVRLLLDSHPKFSMKEKKLFFLFLWTLSICVFFSPQEKDIWSLSGNRSFLSLWEGTQSSTHRLCRFSEVSYPRSKGISWWLSGKELTCNAEDLGSIPWSGRSPGGGNGNPFQDSCLENPMDRGAWQAAVHGVSGQLGNWTTKRSG